MIEEAPLYYTNQNLVVNNEPTDLNPTSLKASFRAFIHDFTKEGVRTYQSQVHKHSEQSRHYLNVSLADMKAFDQQMYEKFIASPLDSLTSMEEELTQYAAEKDRVLVDGQDLENLDRWQLMVTSDQHPKRLREIGNNLVGRMFVVSGIIVSCTKPYLKSSVMKIQCKTCKHIKSIPLNPGEKPMIPRRCLSGPSSKPCDLDSFVVLPTSEVMDEQRMKIQENPEDVPTGEIPRTTSLVCNRYCVDQCVPGDRVRVTGIMMVQDTQKQELGYGYIYITGIEKVKERLSVKYSHQEEEMFRKMAKDGRIYDKIFKSIAPGIYGSEDIKKAIGCMLFGGTRKRLPDGTTLRGDINILLIGDPSTAKSQFLKFVEQTAAIAVYTSGKGSSAAGLTASVNKDPATGEFQIEGGAMVLADGGIVCIDEFDKMAPGDRVAIHEAMEQQTISVAKAGITTRLNSKTSVLAAANPIFGRYDDIKEITDQIELQTTILSRFDCIFVVRDVNTRENNERIANHVLDLHQGKPGLSKHQDTEFPFEMLKKYISFARNTSTPRLSHEACDKLSNLYVADRQKSKEHKSASKHSIPVTVRQLEAIIRLSQSLAKMRLQEEVTSENIDEAHRLFEVSTMKAIEGRELGVEAPANLASEVKRMEQIIKKRVAIGHQVSLTRLIEELEGYPRPIIDHAIIYLVRNGDFKEMHSRKTLLREK